MTTIIDSYSESNQTSTLILHNGNITKDGQTFLGDGRTLDNCKFLFKKRISPAGNAVVKIYAHSGTFGIDGVPTGSALATSENLDVSTLTTNSVPLIPAIAVGVLTTNSPLLLFSTLNQELPTWT